MVAAPESADASAAQTAEALGSAETGFGWSAIGLGEVLKSDLRLKAAVFGIEGRYARAVLENCGWPLAPLAGRGGLAEAFHFPRFKRVWVDRSDLPIYQPGQITELNPQPAGYLSPVTETDIEALRVSSGQILLTCSGRSGSIGRAAYVSRTLNGRIFSHDLIRIQCEHTQDSGYVYAFLRTKIGQALVRANEYGAMIPHIEPFHLEDVPVPNPPAKAKAEIHSLVVRSFALRDESNELLAKAEALLYDELKLPPLAELQACCSERHSTLRHHEVRLSQLQGRLDGSSHSPVVRTILERVEKGAAGVTTLGDPRISRRIVLPGRFARVYVKEGQGAVYFTGKHMLELDPEGKKYLAFSQHARRIREDLSIAQNMLLISCSGNLGKVTLCPKHWDGWVMTHDIIRVIPAGQGIAGFLWVYLASEYGQELLRRYSYGAVVPHIDDRHVASVEIPLLKSDAAQSEINRLALRANTKRSEAYDAEQEAIRRVNQEVIRAGKRSNIRLNERLAGGY